MAFWDLWKRPDIQDGVRRAKAAAGALLLDVREPDEYASGHIPGSLNYPLSTLQSSLPEKGHPLFVYCHSGARSARAASWLKARGYDVENIGGITEYHGPLETGRKSR